MAHRFDLGKTLHYNKIVIQEGENHITDYFYGISLSFIKRKTNTKCSIQNIFVSLSLFFFNGVRYYKDNKFLTLASSVCALCRIKRALQLFCYQDQLLKKDKSTYIFISTEENSVVHMHIF